LHALGRSEVIRRLDTSIEGLDDRQAEERLQCCGPDHIETPPPAPRWRVFLRPFEGPLIYVLLAAGIHRSRSSDVPSLRLPALVVPDVASAGRSGSRSCRAPRRSRYASREQRISGSKTAMVGNCRAIG
jgi:hypothetical protein